MTTTTAAIVLAWIAIAMLTLATAGLLRRVNQLSSRTTLQAEPADSVTGLQLPISRYVDNFEGGFEGGRAGVLLLFLSPSCATCQTAIDSVAAAAPAGDRVAAAVRESTTEPLRVPDGWTSIPSASGLFQILRVPATPYLVRLGPDGTILDATMVVGSLNLPQWLSHQVTAAASNGRSPS